MEFNMDNQIINVAVVSLNGMNQSFAEGFHENPRARIAAVTEDNPPPATGRSTPEETQQGNKDGASKLGVPFVESLDDVLSRTDIDAITLTSPFERRATLVEKIASAGKHIFIDKPMASTLSDADKIIKSVNRHGVKLMVGHNYRFAPPIVNARQSLKKGDIGLPWAIHSEWIVGAGLKAADIGEFMNHAMYPIDALMYLIPSKPKSVYCATGSFFFENAKQNKVEDLGFITMNLEQGIIATTSIGRTSIPHINGYGGDMNIRIMGSHGMSYLDANRPRWVSYGKSGSKTIKFGPSKNLYDTVDHFIECIINDVKPMCSAEEARTTLEITLAALQSASENKVVKLPITK